ncbi:DUF3761 domain-containing protein [Acetobacter pasteurianus]|uniref:DUF3761 domain-containing protein n=1 Tax=Acetobacter pasteurianus TaxID=438 RepID=UPI001363C908
MSVRAVRLLLCVLLPALAPTSAHAFRPSARYSPPSTQQYQFLDESQLQEHRHYKNIDGNVIHSPAHTRSGQAPSGATAKCGDGTFSFSQNHRGTCSRHGGCGSVVVIRLERSYS